MSATGHKKICPIGLVLLDRLLFLALPLLLRPITGLEAQMEQVRHPKQSTYEVSSGLFLFAALIVILAMLTGCGNMTVVKLAEMCHSHEGKPAATFNGDSGKVECR
jgi:hypothetical protein